MKIRDMRQDDETIYIEMANAFYNSPAVLESVPSNHYKKTFGAVLEHIPYIRGLIIEEDAVIIGYVLLSFMWSCEKGGMVVFIDELFIKKEQRGKQYATAFFHWLETEYDKENYHYRLEVNPENPRAQTLYKRLDYYISPYIQMSK